MPRMRKEDLYRGLTRMCLDWEGKGDVAMLLLYCWILAGQWFNRWMNSNVSGQVGEVATTAKNVHGNASLSKLLGSRLQALHP